MNMFINYCRKTILAFLLFLSGVLINNCAVATDYYIDPLNGMATMTMDFKVGQLVQVGSAQEP